MHLIQQLQLVPLYHCLNKNQPQQLLKRLQRSVYAVRTVENAH